jgi:hypothetical protein
MTESTTERAAGKDLPRTSATADDQSRFTYGLIFEVVKVLEAHGYGPFDEGRQLVELSQHLLHFLHGDGDRCYGRSAATAEPAATASAADEPTPGEGYKAEVTHRLTALRESSDAVDRAMARYDQRWGHEL